MPRPQPHPLALFSLVPLNERARAVVANQCNAHLVSRTYERELALDIGHTRPISGDNATLATLGRGGDVVLEGSTISKIQCSFEIDVDTGVVMFYDRSHGQTSQVSGDNATPFEHGRPRKVVVQEALNTVIGMGGVRRDLVKFQLKWHCRPKNTMQKVKERDNARLEENPRLARTVDEAATVLPSRMGTRAHTAGHQPYKTRYLRGDVLGAGQFGTVYKAINVDSGKIMAVKVMARPTGVAHQEEWTKIKREVEILSEISHDHIVEYISSQGWNEPEVEIFMGLKEGTLESLIYAQRSVPITELAHTALHHILQAIDFLAVKDIIHRDIKPENILYVSRQGRFHFQLGDFGLSNRRIIAATLSGTPLYMAPEMFENGEQTHKVDVWSLFVTMLWVMNISLFREASNSLKSYQEAQRMILSAASHVEVIGEMARISPPERASAAQMLVKCFNGQGLSTPRHRIPRLATPGGAGRGAAPAGAPAPTSPEQPRPESGKKANPATARGRFRVEKAGSPQAHARQTRVDEARDRKGQ